MTKLQAIFLVQQAQEHLSKLIGVVPPAHILAMQDELTRLVLEHDYEQAAKLHNEILTLE